MRQRVFGIVAVLSLLLFAVVVWMWGRSFAEDRALVTWTSAGERYTLRSHWGQLAIARPPGEEDSALREIGGRMSNEDFAWTSLAGGYVVGEVREGSATWAMYERVRDEVSESARQRNAERVWLRGLEDEERFLAHHLMLLLVAEDAWRRRWVDERKQPWREGSAAGGQLILFVRQHGAAARPDLSGREQARARWHELLDERPVRIFDGWVALAALALPIAWVARPRREPRTKARWVFNALATASAIMLVIASVGWVRSYRAEDQWTFAPRPVRAKGFYQPLRHQEWAQSRDGKLRWLETQVPESSGWTFNDPPPSASLGYQSKVTVDVPRASVQGYTPKDERYVKWPGLLEYCAMPAQIMERQVQGPVSMMGPMRLTPMQQAAAATMPPGMMLGTVTTRTCYGMRSVEVSWWALVGTGAALPLAWTWRQARWLARERRARGNLCRNCGYDLRASAERCPECGTPFSPPADPSARAAGSPGQP